MAASWYDEGRNNILGGGVHARIDLNTNDIRFTLRDEGALALDLVGDIDVADIAAGIADASWRSGALSGKTVGTVAAGVFDHDDEVLTSVQGPTTVESIDYYDFDTATDSTSPLIQNIDTYTGLPFTPNGGNATIANNASGVYQLNAT